jgi:chemotaxis protein methyltransferase CheR
VSEPVEQFAGLIREVTGNVVPAERFHLLEELALRRARALAYEDVPAYLAALAAGRLDGEWDGLISAVTIKESYFFRAPQQFEALRREVLPRLLAARAEAMHLRIWSAACARGEEPGTLAMLLAEEPALAGWTWRIVATDVDLEALEGARRGIYGERAVSQVPPDLLARWFTRRGKLYELDPGLRASLRYEALNLAQSPYDLPEGEFDLVLLRNVLIYFRRPLQRAVVGQVAGRLAREGYLFLGASETLWQIQDELEAVDLGGCFCYRHGAGDRPISATSAISAALPEREKPAREKPIPAPRRPAPERRKPAKEKPPAPVIATAPPAAVPVSAADRLAAAALLLADNRIAEAGSAVAELLVADPSEPATHALSGFLQDLSGRPEEAVAAYRAALYLDPALFQPRLLLADCLLRLGHREFAEKQFSEVLTLVTSGRERPLAGLAALPLPDRERALRRCRQALREG